MSKAEDLLKTLNNDDISSYLTKPDVEEHIVVGSNRIITVPESLRRIAVQYDHNIETVVFDCPRYWDGWDMSEMNIYIKYKRSDNDIGMCLCGNVEVDELNPDIMHFTWTVSTNATLVEGPLSFLVSIHKLNSYGKEETHWHSELNDNMYVSKGLTCEDAIIGRYPDIIDQLLSRMDLLEMNMTPEKMVEYIERYLQDNFGNNIVDRIDAFLNSINIKQYLNTYFKEHPLLFTVGPNDPNKYGLWFKTNDVESANVEMDLTGNMGDIFIEAK